MTHEAGYITLGKERLHFIKWGLGTRLLLAFHGYGNDAVIFSPFVHYLQKDFTILSFNLPHHGDGKWKENTPLTRNDLVNLVETLKASYNVDEVSLLGYSLGGRVCLTIMELLPSSIDKVLLLAPDGLKREPLYFFITRTWVGRKLFYKLLNKPGFLFMVIDWLHRHRWVDPARHRFVMHYLESERSRKFLLQVWPGLKDIVPGITKLKKSIGRYKIPVSIFLGSHDHIIPPSNATKFKDGVNTVQVHILEKGHRIFDADNIREIAACLL